MRFRLLALALASLPSLLLAQEASKPAPEIVVLKAARLFDGKGDAAVPNGVVIVEGGTIRAAGSGLAVPAGARVIDLGDATLLPGLIDAHTHMSGESQDNWLSGHRRPPAADAPRGLHPRHRLCPEDAPRPASPRCATSAPATSRRRAAQRHPTTA